MSGERGTCITLAGSQVPWLTWSVPGSPGVVYPHCEHTPATRQIRPGMTKRSAYRSRHLEGSCYYRSNVTHWGMYILRYDPDSVKVVTYYYVFWVAEFVSWILSLGIHSRRKALSAYLQMNVLYEYYLPISTLV